MRVNETVGYEDGTPHQVFDLICDEGFRGAVCETMHATSHDVTVKREGDTATVTITREIPAEMPDFVKSVVGDTVTVRQTERWYTADAGGARKGTVEMQIVGQPVSMTGTTALQAADGRTDLTLEGEVRVKVPIIGKKVEPEVVRAIVGALRTEATEGSARLKQQV